MKDYPYEDGVIDTKKLEASFIPSDIYKEAHKGLIIVCHDVFIETPKGFFFMKRDNFPLKGDLFVPGGRILRGVSTEESLKIKVKQECGFEINNIKFLGVGRTLFKTDPFGHGKGTDTMNLVYYAKSTSAPKLDNLHKSYHFFPANKITKEFLEPLHPYVKDFLEKAVKASQKHQ